MVEISGFVELSVRISITHLCQPIPPTKSWLQRAARFHALWEEAHRLLLPWAYRYISSWSRLALLNITNCQTPAGAAVGICQNCLFSPDRLCLCFCVYFPCTLVLCLNYFHFLCPRLLILFHSLAASLLGLPHRLRKFLLNRYFSPWAQIFASTWTLRANLVRHTQAR